MCWQREVQCARGHCNGRLAIGLDAGAAHTRCVVSRVDRETLRLLGYGHAVSRGWAQSRIEDQDEVTLSIMQSVQAAGSTAHASVSSAVLGIGSTSANGIPSKAEVEPLLSAANRAHLAVEEVVFEPLAASSAVLTNKNADRDAIIVDVGAQWLAYL